VNVSTALRIPGPLVMNVVLLLLVPVIQILPVRQGHFRVRP
jgi:hypothetical protein